ncbi:unnamed protein product [Vicia faba]|uniref:Uncharacterized protein n=1 Tax=Vicia faba TaxID=3906 RepID=A0AAV0YSS9_VICFA|nr:unnamed protein product [Vicia faba]
MGRRGKPLKKQATTPPVTVRVFSQLLIKGEPEATKEGQGIVIQLVTTFTSCVSEKQSETLEPIEEEEREKMEEEDEDEAKPKQPWVDIVRGKMIHDNIIMAHKLVRGSLIFLQSLSPGLWFVSQLFLIGVTLFL